MPEPANDTPDRLELRKYPNRRYYDTTRSTHVTLEEIYELIRDGLDVRVTDSKTGEDITGKVLAQIILEHDAPKLDVFPSELLHKLIRSNEQLVQDFVEKYFNQALGAFLSSQKQFEEYLRQAVGLNPALAANPHLAQALLGAFNPAVMTANAAGGASASAPTAEADELRQMVDELRRQVADLQSARGQA